MLFGIEIELVGLDRDQTQAVLEQAGIDCEVRRSHVNTDRTTSWKVVPDGSVSGGCEIVSPPMEMNQASFDLIRKVCEAVNDAGADVNRSCGLHVHFDASSLTMEHVASINNRYAQFESEIDRLMAKSRRGSENRYCKSITQRLIRPEQINRNGDYEIIGCRYYKLNLASLYKHGTIEFRQHQGTVNASKIIKWVEFLAQFIEASTPVAIDSNAAQVEALYQAALQAYDIELAIWNERRTELHKIRTALNCSGKRAQIIMCMTGEDRHTADRIAEIVGTTRASVQSTVSTLRRAGVAISGDANHGYHIVAQAELGPRPVAPTRPSIQYTAVRTNDDLWNGITPAIKSYYARRRSILAQAS